MFSLFLCKVYNVNKYKRVSGYRAANGSHRSGEMVQVTALSQANGRASGFMVAANREASNDGAETLGLALQALFKIVAEELLEIVCIEELIERIGNLSNRGAKLLTIEIGCGLLNKKEVLVDICVVDKVCGGGEGEEDWSVGCFHVEVRFLG